MAKRYDESEDKLKMLVYGEPGSGKTRLCGTAEWHEALAPALMLEAFGNPISIRDYDKKPDIISLESFKDFNPPFDWIQKGQPEDHPYCQKFNLTPPYKTIIIDGLTEVQRFVIRTIQGGKYTDPGDLMATLDRRGFNQLLGTMLNWAVNYMSLDMHVILTSLNWNKEVSNGIRKDMPLLWGSSGGEIAGYAYLVTRLTTSLAAPKRLMAHPEDPVTEDTEIVAYFRETATYFAKDQYYIGVDHMTDPTLPKIMDLIEWGS